MSQILWAGFETTTVPYIRKKKRNRKVKMDII